MTRIYNLVTDDSKANSAQSSVQLSKLLNQTIKKVEEDISKLKYNTAIAKLMEFINEWEKSESALCHVDTSQKIYFIS